MSIKTIIQTQLLLPRLRKHGVLVVYDPERRCRELCLELASERRVVVDAGESSIESRAAALAALQTLGRPNSPLEGLLVYVPAAKSLTDEAKQRDVFSLYAACGAVFPDGDGDEYLSLAWALWPGRVVSRCAADVELAEGHEVWRFLWVRRGGVWRRRAAMDAVTDEVVRRQGLQYS
jgi:hypothetical protein